MAYFTEKEISEGLAQIAQKTIEYCGPSINRKRKHKDLGLERIFQDAFTQYVLLRSNWTKRDQVPRKELPDHPFRARGWLDALYNYDGERASVAVEFKVIRLPRVRATSCGSITYDIEQLAWDYASLKAYKKGKKNKLRVDHSYLIVLLHGELVSADWATNLSVAKQFHKAMHDDYQHAVRWGRYQSDSKEVRHQVEALKEMSFDEPFGAYRHSKYSFCKIFRKHGLAVVGLHVR